MKKQILSFITMIVMIMGIIPIGTVTAVSTGNGWSFDSAKKSLTITDSEGASAWHESDELNFTEIETIVIGSEVTSIEDNIFADCYALKNFNVDSKNPNYKSNNGVLYNKSETEFLRYPPSKNGNSYTILKTVAIVHDYAFDGAGKLTSIKISDNTTSIGSYAFRDCVLLKSLTIPANVAYIGENAFLNCFATIEYLNDIVTESTITTTTTTKNTTTLTATTTTTTKNTTTPTATTTITNSATTTKPITTTTAAITTTTTTSIDSKAPNSTTAVKPNNMTEQEFVSAKLDEIAEQIKKENDTDLERLDAICKWIAGFEYSVSYYTPSGYILYGGGDCWACARTIVELAWRLGLRAKERDASTVNTTHRNAVVEIDGIPYIADVGSSYTEKAPRTYYINPYPSGFMTSQFNSDVSIHDYIGFDTDVYVPSVIDGKKVVSIEEKAFDNNNIEKITVAEGVKTINAYAFYACDKLKELNLPSTISNIQEAPFSGADILETINIAESNPYFTVKNGIIYSKDEKTVVAAPFANAKGSITLSDKVTTIAKNAFYNCYELTNISFSNNLSYIAVGAFYKCKNLKSISIPNNITVIEDWTFAYCESLTKINIPISVTNIEKSAFYGCKSLENITIRSNVININDTAFEQSPKIVFNGYIGSVAQIYASKMGIPFNSLTPVKINLTSFVTLVKFFPNVDDSYDLNHDGKIDVIDIAILRRKLLTNPIDDNDPKTVIIRFEKNDGSGVYSSIDTSKGGKAPVWTRDGYNFVGWSMDESAKNADLSDPLKSKASCTYYAVWKSTSTQGVKIKFDRESVVLLPESVNPYTGTGTFAAGRSQVNAEVLRDGIVSDERINWSIDNTEIIGYGIAGWQDIDLWGKTAGTAVLTATTDDGFKAACKITVVNDVSYYDDFAYIADDNTAIIVGYRGAGGDVTIPGVILGKPVSEVRRSAFDMINNKLYAEAGCEQITGLTISNGIKILGDNAFQSLSSVTSISIPASVISMVTCRFTSLVLTEIKVDPLNPNYTSVDGVLFNKTKTVLHKYPPQKKDTEYIIPDSVIAIDIDAFRNSLSLKSVTMSANLVQIARNGFRLCDNLESVYFKGDTPLFANGGPNVSAYAHVFKNAGGKNLPKLTLYYPQNNLSWTYPEWNGYPTAPWNPNENVTDYSYTINGEEVTITGYNGNDSYVLIPSVIEGKRVTAIADNAFKNQSDIISVIIPEGVTTIGRNSFALCDNLVTVIIPSTIKNINSEAFYNCKGLTYVFFRGNRPTIGSRVFDGAPDLLILYDFYDPTWKEYNRSVAFWNGYRVHYSEISPVIR